MVIRSWNIIDFLTTGFLLICFLIAIFCYFILDDKTPNGDKQFLALSLVPIGSSFWVLTTKDTISDASEINVNGFFFGEEEEGKKIPVKNLEVRGEMLHFEKIIHWRSSQVDKDSIKMKGDGSIKVAFEKKYFLLGTDRYGRSLLSRVFIGLRYSLFIGLFAVVLSIFIGVMVGLIAGYFGGFVDLVLNYLMTVIWSIPTVLLVFAVVIAFGKSIPVLVMAIALTIWVDLARVVRSQTKSLIGTLYIQSTVVLGFNHFRIMLKHLLPNLLPTVLVMGSNIFASAILLEAGLGYLGLGVQPPTPTLGNILNENFSLILGGYPNLVIIPSLFIICLVLSFNIFSDRLKILLTNQLSESDYS